MNDIFSVPLTKQEYCYLLPVERSKLLCRVFDDGVEEYAFIGSGEDIEFMKRRLKYLDIEVMHGK